MMNVNYLYAHKPPTLSDNNVGIIDKLKTNKREVGHILCTDICLRVSGMSRLHPPFKYINRSSDVDFNISVGYGVKFDISM